MLKTTENSTFVIYKEIESCFLQSISNPRSINAFGIFLLLFAIKELVTPKSLENSAFEKMCCSP